MEEFVWRALLDDAAEIHNGNVIRDLPHDLEIMTDEEIGHAEMCLYVLQKIDNLSCHGNVESRNGLVADDKFGVEHQCAGEDSPLSLPA